MSSPASTGLRAAIFACSLATTMLAAMPTLAFQLVPISQQFDPSGRGANQVFQIENDRDEPVTVTISMTKRIVDIDGNEQMPETEDFTVFPTEIILQPKASRAVRVKWLGDPAPASELAYRIIAEETPLNMRRDSPGASVFLTVRYIGSIYVTPKGAKVDVTVASVRPVSGNQMELIVENRGNRHAIIDEPTLTVSSGGSAVKIDPAVLEKVLTGENLLAGAKRRFLLPMPPGLSGGNLSAQLKFTPLQ